MKLRSLFVIALLFSFSERAVACGTAFVGPAYGTTTLARVPQRRFAQHLHSGFGFFAPEFLWGYWAKTTELPPPDALWSGRLTVLYSDVSLGSADVVVDARGVRVVISVEEPFDRFAVGQYLLEEVRARFPDAVETRALGGG